MSFFSSDDKDKSKKREPVEAEEIKDEVTPVIEAPTEVVPEDTTDGPGEWVPPKTPKHPQLMQNAPKVLTPEELAAKEEKERVEAFQLHLKTNHGVFTSQGVTMPVLRAIHAREETKIAERDKTDEKQPWQYVPHKHLPNGEVTYGDDIPDNVPEEWSNGQDVFHP